MLGFAALLFDLLLGLDFGELGFFFSHPSACFRRKGGAPASVPCASSSMMDELQALLRGVDAVEQDVDALADTEAAAPAFADDLAGVFAEV